MGSSVSRTTQFANLSKVLKKHYKPVAPDAQRTVLEHLVFACCLEDAHYDVAEEAFAALDHTFFDWNEVRVTTISELCEVMASLPDRPAAANRVKRVLQAVFEAIYSFDLEEMRKKNLGPTVKWLSDLDGTTEFVVAYVVQSALGGHSIPVDTGTLRVLRILDLITDEDFSARTVPGLERAVPKSKGVDFGSMLHQLGADFTKNPFSPRVREILLQVNPEIEERLPKRRAAKAAETADGKSRRRSKRRAEPGPEQTVSDESPPAAPPTAPPEEQPPPPTEEAAAGPPTEDAISDPPPAADVATEKKSSTDTLSKRKPR
jgi:endonuclease III